MTESADAADAEEPHLNDEAIGRMLAVRPEQGLSEVVRTHGPKLKGFLHSRFPASIADDALQETFVRAWQHSAKFDPSRGTLGGWLTKIAQREALRILATERDRRSATLDAYTEDTRTFSPPAESEVRRLTNREKALREIIAKLPKRQQEVTHADMAAPSGTADSADLAAALGCTVNSVCSQRSKARARIRDEMITRGHAVPEDKA